MKNLGIPYAVGYLIAGLILLPLLIFIVNNFFFKGNEINENIIKNYLENSVNLPVVIDLEANKPKYTIEDLKNNKEDGTFGYEIYTAFLSRGGGKIYIDKLTFYAKEYEKFFTIRLTNMGDQFNLFEVIQHLNNKVIITVNKDDINNIKFGTRDRPVPVFKVVGDGKPLLIDRTVNGKTTYENLDITQKEYENSVSTHLKYIMTKEEFKERFEKNK